MELTRERIEIYANAHVDAEIRSMAKQLLAEMDKPKVWTNAPECASSAMVVWYGKDGRVAHSSDYTRTLPKSSIDELAEEAASKWAGGKKALEDAIKSAIIRALEEKEAER